MDGKAKSFRLKLSIIGVIIWSLCNMLVALNLIYGENRSFDSLKPFVGGFTFFLIMSFAKTFFYYLSANSESEP